MKVNKINNSFSDKKILGIDNHLFYVLLGALLLRLLFFAIYVSTGGTGEVADTSSYVNVAWSFVKDFTFGVSPLRTPGYPFVLSLCMFLFGNSFYYGIVLVQALLNVLSIYYLHKLAMLVIDNRVVAYIAVIIAALNPLDVYYCYLVLTDSISQSLLVISVYFYARYIVSIKNKTEKKDLCSLGVSSVLLAMNVLVRPSIMFLPFALAIGAAFVALVCRQYKQIIISALCISLVSSLCIALWTERNERVADYPGYSSVSDINIYIYNSAEVYAKQNGLTYYEANTALREHKDDGLTPYLETMPKYDAYRKRGMELIMSDLPYYITCCMKNCLYLVAYPGVMSFSFVSNSLSDVITSIKSGGDIISSVLSILDAETFGVLSVLALDVMLLVLLAALAVLGTIKNLKKDWILTLLIVGVLAYNIVVLCQPVGIGAYSRFRLACSMFTNMFAAYGLYEIWLFFKNIFKRKGV